MFAVVVEKCLWIRLRLLKGFVLGEALQGGQFYGGQVVEEEWHGGNAVAIGDIIQENVIMRVAKACPSFERAAAAGAPGHAVLSATLDMHFLGELADVVSVLARHSMALLLLLRVRDIATWGICRVHGIVRMGENTMVSIMYRGESIVSHKRTTASKDA